MAKVLPFFLAAFFSAAALAALLHGDLRDEVAHLPDRRLRFVLAGASMTSLISWPVWSIASN